MRPDLLSPPALFHLSLLLLPLLCLSSLVHAVSENSNLTNALDPEGGQAVGIDLTPEIIGNQEILVFQDMPNTTIIERLKSKILTLASMHLTVGNWPDELLDVVKPLLKYREPIIKFSSMGNKDSPDRPIVTQSSPPGWALTRISERTNSLSADSYSYPASAGAGVNVYIVDSGINLAHTDLEGRASWGTSIGSTITTDDNGHGTFVAGIIGGAKYGVAKKCNMIAIKVLDSEGVSDNSQIIAGIQWVVEKHNNSTEKRSVLNLSLDGPTSQAVNDAVAAAVAQGIVVIAAAGNGNSKGIAQDACRYSPASAMSITVGATTKTDGVATFSNFGPCVSIYAPGVQVESISASSESGTLVKDGTSFAAPYVSGVAALILGEYGPMSPAEVKQRILAFATSGVIKNPPPASPNSLLYTTVPSLSSPSPVSSMGGIMISLVVCLLFHIL